MAHMCVCVCVCVYVCTGGAIANFNAFGQFRGDGRTPQTLYSLIRQKW